MSRRQLLLCGVALVLGALPGCGGGGAARSASPGPGRPTVSPSARATVPNGAAAFVGRWKWSDTFGQGTLIIRLRTDGTFLVRDRGLTGGGGQGGQGWNYTMKMRCIEEDDGALVLRRMGSGGHGETVRMVGEDEIVVAPPPRHCSRAAGG